MSNLHCVCAHTRTRARSNNLYQLNLISECHCFLLLLNVTVQESLMFCVMLLLSRQTYQSPTYTPSLQQLQQQQQSTDHVEPHWKIRWQNASAGAGKMWLPCSLPIELFVEWIQSVLLWALPIIITAEQISFSHAPIFSLRFLLHALHTQSRSSSSNNNNNKKSCKTVCWNGPTYTPTSFRINGYWRMKLFALYFSRTRTLSTYKIWSFSFIHFQSLIDILWMSLSLALPLIHSFNLQLTPCSRSLSFTLSAYTFLASISASILSVLSHGIGIVCHAACTGTHTHARRCYCARVGGAEFSRCRTSIHFIHSFWKFSIGNGSIGLRTNRSARTVTQAER